MMIFELRQTDAGYELTGGQLKEPLKYPDPNAVEYTARLAGFLSQKTGGEMRVYAADGDLVSTRSFRICMWPTGTILGNMRGDSCDSDFSRRVPALRGL